MTLTDTTYDGGFVVITIDGALEYSNVHVLDELLAAHHEAGNHRLIFDLTRCSHIDESGRHALWALARTLRGTGALAVAGSQV